MLFACAPVVRGDEWVTCKRHAATGQLVWMRDEKGLHLDVLTHEAIHFVQDCLDGLETPSSSKISLMLQSQGGFSPAQVDRFFCTLSLLLIG